MRSPKAKSKHKAFSPIALVDSGSIFSRKFMSKPFIIGLIIIFASVGSYLWLFSNASSLTADFNNDSNVNIMDLSILATNWNSTNATFAMGDANSDGTVNIFDLSALASQWGQTASPTPTIPADALNLTSFGAKGDGVTNDTAAINNALAQARQTGKTLYVPAGSFLITSQIIAPDGVHVIGLGESSWLMGPIKYGSNETWTNLRIGARYAASVRNGNGAHDTTFQSVRFSGGGGQNGSNGSANLGFGGPDGSLTNIAFYDCKFDATFTQPNGDTTGDNVVSIGEEDDDNAHIQNLWFVRCIFGSSNGTRTGSPRFGLEALSRSETHYLTGLHIIDSTFEPTDETALDIESSSTGPLLTDILIQGNLIKGGNPNFASPQYQQSLCLELGRGVRVLNNTIWGAKWSSIEIYSRSGGASPSNAVISNNVIDATLGVAPADWAVHLNASQITFTGNTIKYRADQIYGVAIDGGTSNLITGNTFTRVGGTAGAAIFQFNGASGNTTTPNTIQ